MTNVHVFTIKVIIASSNKSSENQSDEEIFAQLSRLFLTIPKHYTEDDIRSLFEVQLSNFSFDNSNI